MRKTLALLIGVSPMVCLAQLAAPTVATDAQVKAYQLGIETGCRDAGKSRNDPPAQVDSVCGCFIKTLMEVVPADTWKQATLHSISGRRDLEAQDLAPYTSKLSKCAPTRQPA